MIYGFQVFFIVAAIFALIVGTQLLFLRKWARIAILIIAGCAIFFGIMGVGVIAFRAIVVPSVEPAGIRVALNFVLALVYGVPLGLGIWWVILFTRPSIAGQFLASENFRREPLSNSAATAAFAPSGDSLATSMAASSVPDLSIPTSFHSPASHFSRLNNPANPLAIRIIGWYYASFVLFLPFLFLIPRNFPVLMFGRVFHGPTGIAITLVNYAVFVAAGFGLLLLKRWSYPFTAVSQLLHIVNAIMMTRSGFIEAQMRDFVSSMNLPPQANPGLEIGLHIASFSVYFGLLFPIAILTTLVICRKNFFAATNPPTSAPNP